MTNWILAVLALFFVQSVIAPVIRYVSAGKAGVWIAMGGRDNPPPMPPIGGRLDRALKNMFEALVVFLPLALLIEIKGLAEGAAITGAMVFFWARVVYVPAYASGIPGLRTAVWTIGHAGLVMMVAVLLRIAG